MSRRVQDAVFAAQEYSLRRNFSRTLVGTVGYSTCLWVIVVSIARLGSSTLVGRYALGLALSAPVMLLLNLGLRALQATDARQDFAFGDYLAMRIWSTAVGFCAVATLILLGGYGAATTRVVLSVAAFKAVESLSDVFYGAMQQRSQMGLISASLLLRGISSVVAMIVMLWLTGSVAWGALLIASTWVVVLLGFDSRRVRGLMASNMSREERRRPAGIAPVWNLQHQRNLLVLALPLGITAMLISLSPNVPRYFVASVLGESELGVYAALGYVAVAGGLIVNALGQSASPRLARLRMSDNYEGFAELITRLSLIGVGLGVAGVLGAWLFGAVLLNALYGPSYASQNSLFIWIMAGGTLSYVTSFLGYGLTALREFRVQPLIVIVSTGTVAFGCWILLPEFGLLGAAWGLALGLLVHLVGFAAVLWRVLGRWRGTCEEPGA